MSLLLSATRRVVSNNSSRLLYVTARRCFAQQVHASLIGHQDPPATVAETSFCTKTRFLVNPYRCIHELVYYFAPEGRWGILPWFLFCGVNVSGVYMNNIRYVCCNLL